MSIAPWVFAIAARVRLDELRRRKRLAEDGDEEALARADESAALAEPIAVATPARMTSRRASWCGARSMSCPSRSG